MPFFMFNEKSGEVKLLSRIAVKQKVLLENSGFKVLDNLEYEKPLYVVYKCEKCNKFEIFYKKFLLLTLNTIQIIHQNEFYLSLN